LSEFDWIFEEVSSAIRVLVEKFIEMPYFFYSEQDMHAYLYHKLISGKLGEFFVETHFGDKSVLLHREYPTLRIYPGGRRGHFDLAIIDPKYASESQITKYILENCSFRFLVIDEFEEMVRLEHFTTAVLGPLLNTRLKR